MTDGHTGNSMMFTLADVSTRMAATLLGRQVVSVFKDNDSNPANMSASVWAFGHACRFYLCCCWCLCNPKERLPLVWDGQVHDTLED